MAACLRATLVVVALATAGCSLVSLDGLTGGRPEGPSDSGREAEPEETGPPPPTTTYAKLVISDGPLAYWRLNETSGRTAYDSSGNGHDATYMGNVHLGGSTGAIAGDPDTAALFDGMSGYVDAGNALFAFSGSQPFTVEAWVRPAPVAGYGGIASCEDTVGGPPSEGYLVFASPMDGVFGFQRLDGASLTSVTSMTSASAMQYTHVVAVFDSNLMTLYVNGAPEDSQTATFAILGAVNDFVIGAESGGNAEFFAGAIDEVAVYDKPLPAKRVSAHYAVGTGQ